MDNTDELVFFPIHLCYFFLSPAMQYLLGFTCVARLYFINSIQQIPRIRLPAFIAAGSSI